MWAVSPQKRSHAALHYLWSRADTEEAWRWLGLIAREGIGIKFSGRTDLPLVGTTVDAYKGNWLAVWACAVTVLEAYLTRTGDPNNHLSQVREWADEAVASIIMAQVPASGIFRDYNFGWLCQPEHSGGIFNGFNQFDDTRHQSQGWTSFLFETLDKIGTAIGAFRRDPDLMPHHMSTPTSYEPTYWSMVALTYYLKNRF